MRSPSWTRTWLVPKLRASLSLSAYPYPLTPEYRMARSQSPMSPLTSGKRLISAAPYPLRKPPILAWVAPTLLTRKVAPFSVTPSGQNACPVLSCACATVAVRVRATTTAARAAVRRSRGGQCQAGHGVSPCGGSARWPQDPPGRLINGVRVQPPGPDGKGVGGRDNGPRANVSPWSTSPTTEAM